jgi:hypothetical protein
MTWNLNLSEAPRGETVWVATKDGRVRTGMYGDLDGLGKAAWYGCAPPLAFQRMVAPLHPHHMPPAELSPVSADALPFIDDVGGAEHE